MAATGGVETREAICYRGIERAGLAVPAGLSSTRLSVNGIPLGQLFRGNEILRSAVRVLPGLAGLSREAFEIASVPASDPVSGAGTLVVAILGERLQGRLVSTVSRAFY